MANDFLPNRRLVIAGLAGAALAPLRAFAISENAATSLVQTLVTEIQKVIGSGKSDAQIYRDFEKIFERYADVPTIARFSLGVAARSASASEMRAYTDAFSGYIARKYGKRFDEFIGGKVTVKRARADGKFMVVETLADLRGQSPFRVDFHVSDRSGKDKVFNVIIEGINMLTTERTEIGALLDQSGGSVSKLTQRLKSA